MLRKICHFPVPLPLLLVTAILVLGGCGQKGDLYLPDKGQQAHGYSSSGN